MDQVLLAIITHGTCGVMSLLRPRTRLRDNQHFGFHSSQTGENGVLLACLHFFSNFLYLLFQGHQMWCFSMCSWMRFEICLLNMLWMVGFLDMEGREEILFFSTMAWMGWTSL